MNNTIKSPRPNSLLEIESLRRRFDSLLISSLSQRWGSVHPRWKERLLYSLNRGGKRVRATLIYLVGKAYGLSLLQLDPIAQAVEIIHAYSLVHDDLPAMDDDDFRRGYPSAHKAFNDADAILIGDGLLSEAINLICQASSIAPLARLSLIEHLSFSAGPLALVYGQWLDLCQNLQSFDQLADLHHKKTGALFAFCLLAPAVVAGQNQSIDRLSQVGLDLGLAFQVQDDLLDLLPMACTGKTCGKDAQQGKKTAVMFLGEEGAASLSHTLYENSKSSLRELFPGSLADDLVALIDLLQLRKI